MSDSFRRMPGEFESACLERGYELLHCAGGDASVDDYVEVR